MYLLKCATILGGGGDGGDGGCGVFKKLNWCGGNRLNLLPRKSRFRGLSGRERIKRWKERGGQWVAIRKIWLENEIKSFSCYGIGNGFVVSLLICCCSFDLLLLFIGCAGGGGVQLDWSAFGIFSFSQILSFLRCSSSFSLDFFLCVCNIFVHLFLVYTSLTLTLPSK